MARFPRRWRPLLETLEDRTLLAASIMPNDFAVSKARAVSMKHVEILFSQPAGSDIDLPNDFKITGSRGQTLRVKGVDVSADRTTAVLTTTAQRRMAYRVGVAGSRSSAKFSGSKSDAGILVHAAALDNTTVVLRFSKRVGKGARNASSYTLSGGLVVQSAEVKADGKTVVLTTSPQGRVLYEVTAAGVRDGKGNAFDPSPRTFVGISVDQAQPLPRVSSAASTANTKVVVSFDRPMDDSAINPQSYVIVQSNVNSEAGRLFVTGAAFTGEDRTTVELTTTSQNELTYQLTVVNVRDLGGNPLGPPTAAGGVILDPAKATFRGMPPSGNELVDTDRDGLSDNEEQRGWTVVFTTVTGDRDRVTRQVTSNPLQGDTDLDGLTDVQEAQLRIDPRDRDTDDDSLTDWQEYNEIFSDPLNQDGDGDTLDDATEYLFFKTSPVHKDTDGDQIFDNVEVVSGTFNARVANLPLPAIEIGEVNLLLDARFTATSSQGTRTLESKSVQTTLTQTESQKFGNSDANTATNTAKVGFEIGYNVGTAESKFSGKLHGDYEHTSEWTSTFTSESAKETQEEISKSFTTDKEISQEETVQRSIERASMRVGINFKSIGKIAFTLKDVQVTAFVQDPRNPGRLLPIATLVPEVPAEGGYNLGPFIPERGPFIFVNDQIFPALVQDLMLDPRGLVFKVSNYNMVDERGRNFAFTSQEVNDHTVPLIIDFGGADTDGDGEGDYSERYRVATYSGRTIDTNGNGSIDAGDRRVSFDANGKAVGITVRDALETILGLTRYDEAEVAQRTKPLTPLEIENSYSFKIIDGIETIWRIRGVAQDANSPLKKWEVLTPTGIDRGVHLSDRLLQPGGGITFAFVQDLDNDRVPAVWEAIHGSSDSSPDTDGDGLDDGFEFFGRGPDSTRPTGEAIWNIDVAGKGSYAVVSSPARKDTDLDGLSDFDEYNRFVNGVRRSTDPRSPDTDKDGVSDRQEIQGYTIALRFPQSGAITFILVETDPLNPDHDGDTLKDGDERTLGTDPTVDDLDKVLDDDGDGLVNFEENLGRTVKYFKTSTTALSQGPEMTQIATSAINNPDTDGDGLTDKQERDLGTDPRTNDTDVDGLTDAQEAELVGGQLKYNPLDADIDNDRRSDGDEVNKPWTVIVAGQGPRLVSSDPKKADEDLDGLLDDAEQSAGTDPALFDTDGDNAGIGDKREMELGTNPLRKDKRVRFAVSKITLHDGHEDPSTHEFGEFSGTIRLYVTTASPANIFTFSNRDLKEGSFLDIDITRDFILTEGMSITFESTNFWEDDVGSATEQGGDDDDLTEFSHVFTYDQLPPLGSPPAMENKGETARFVTSYSIEVVTELPLFPLG